MKVAVLIAKFPSGWRPLLVGGQIAEIKTAFKSAKGAGLLVHEGEPAELVMLFDSAGNVSRKFLRTPTEIELRDAGREQFAAAMEAREQRAADAQAEADGTRAALELADKAVAFVAKEIAGGAIAPDAVSGAEHQRLCEELARVQGLAAERYERLAELEAELARFRNPGVSVVATPEPAAAPQPASDEPADEADLSARFGGTRKTPPGKPGGKR